MRKERVVAEERIGKSINENFESISREVSHQNELHEQQQMILSTSLTDEFNSCYSKLESEINESSSMIIQYDERQQQYYEETKAILTEETLQRKLSESKLLKTVEEMFERFKYFCYL